MFSIVGTLFKHCSMSNPLAWYGSIFFLIFATSVIVYQVDKYTSGGAQDNKPKQAPQTHHSH